ncbi:MAG TPA: 2,4-diaminopentanoate dehydrogenase [Bacilli bacterium]|jgi:4-hydroxy-tetrahydrodipicolinate reductase|nr:2,4-diaminopentanoate dehydrogenase [Bacilli bacterium]
MRKEVVKVVIWGFGAMGSGMAKMITRKQGFEIIGVCDRFDKLVGQKVSDLIGTTSNLAPDLIVKKTIEEIIPNVCPDVALLCTDSFTEKAFPKIKWLLEHQVNVITTAEEMAFPWANRPDLAKELDQIAKKNGVSVLGAGINPGLMMDLLVILLTGAMETVDKIEVRRINSLSPYGETVMTEQGVGLSVSEFQKLKEKGLLAGHVGFKESVGMIAHALGWDVESFEQEMLPIITDVDRKSPYGFAPKGHVAGVNMMAHAIISGEEKLTMLHPQQIEPQLGGIQTGDYITLQGKPKIKMAITPEVEGGTGTIAICVNMIPHIINAKPGLKTMLDLPVPRAIMGDVRKMIEVNDHD